MARTPTHELSMAAWLPRYRVAVCQRQASMRKLVWEGSRIFLRLSGLHHFGCRHKPTQIQKEAMYIPHEGMPMSHYKKNMWNGKNFPTLENTITQFVTALTVYWLWEDEENKGSSNFLHFVAQMRNLKWEELRQMSWILVNSGNLILTLGRHSNSSLTNWLSPVISLVLLKDFVKLKNSN